jgi:hypothetical protein
MSGDVNYKKNGPKGRTCADCKHYEADKMNAKIGKCMGQDVEADATCDLFEPKSK